MGNYIACVAACNEVKPYFILIYEDKAFACKKKTKKKLACKAFTSSQPNLSNIASQ